MVLLEIDVDDLGGGLHLSVDYMAIDSVGVHRSGVTDDALEHGFRHFIFQKRYECVSEAIRTAGKISLLRDPDPVIPERALGKRPADLGAEDPGRVELRIPENVLVDDPSRDLVEIDPSLRVLVLSLGDLVSAVDGSVDRQDVVLDVAGLYSEDLSGAKARDETKAEYIDVPVGGAAAFKEAADVGRLKDHSLTLVCGGRDV